MNAISDIAGSIAALKMMSPFSIYGTVLGLGGLAVTLEGFGPLAAIGDRVRLDTPSGKPVLAEIAAFRDSKAEAYCSGARTGLSAGARAVLIQRPVLSVSDAPGSDGSWTLWDTRWMAGPILRRDHCRAPPMRRLLRPARELDWAQECRSA